MKNLELYIRSMGKALKVVAWVPDTEEGTRLANKHMERNHDDAVVASGDGLILLARTWDEGVSINDRRELTGISG